MADTKLIDNGWNLLIYRNGLGTYNALAFRAGTSADSALEGYMEHKEADEVPIQQLAFDGPNRFCGEGFTIEEAINTVTEKVLFKRLPSKTT